MKIKIDWVDELSLSLAETWGNINDIEGSALDKVLDPAFMKKYTDFSSIQEMFDKSGFTILDQKDLEKTKDIKFILFLKKTSKFTSWHEMLLCAGKEYIKGKIIDL